MDSGKSLQLAMRTKEGVYLVDRHTTTGEQQKNRKVSSRHSAFMAYTPCGTRVLAVGSQELQVMDSATHDTVGSIQFA